MLWGVVITNLAAQAGFADNSQLMAVFAGGRYPDLTAKLAMKLRLAKQNAAAADMALEAVQGDPLNVRALSTLGLSLEQLGETVKATKLMRLAAALGWRDTPTLVWAFEDAARRDDVVRAIDIADALARRQAVKPLTKQIFFASLGDARLRSALVARLARRPAWRATFFADVSESLPPSQAEGMELMLHELAVTPAPPSADERLKYVGRLVSIGEYARARLYWAKAFSINFDRLATVPFDSHFVRAAKNKTNDPQSPFEWQINPDLDDTVSFVGGHALRVDAGMPNGTVVTSQTLLLGPGNHRIDTHLASGRGSTAPVGWMMMCLPSKQSLLRTINGDRNDELSAVSIMIPVVDCKAQVLQLIANDRIEANTVTIDAVTVR
ncbi:hypothetical protein N4G62_13340 [Sphingomonas sanguinis]|uniref:Tetratricopeptide repeat protein n=2 Tax=Sphingomonas sanguinis TaxID=33051 RepID=A0ABU5LTD6_9SPHN|nr:hypothetical protein [Sphingomonas sanguinis]